MADDRAQQPVSPAPSPAGKKQGIAAKQLLETASQFLPRSPGIELPSRQEVLDSTYFFQQSPVANHYIVSAHVSLGAEPKYGGSYEGFLVFLAYGVVFLTGRDRQSTMQELAAQGAEHILFHTLGEALGGGLAGIATGWLKDKVRSDKYKEAFRNISAAIVIPAPSIVDVRVGRLPEQWLEKERWYLHIRSQDAANESNDTTIFIDEDNLFSLPKKIGGFTGIMGENIWQMRLTFELLYSDMWIMAQLLTPEEKDVPNDYWVVSKFITPEDQAWMMETYMSAQLIGKPSLSAWRKQANALLVHINKTIETLVEYRSWYHLRHFRKVPILNKLYEKQWQLMDAFTAQLHLDRWCFFNPTVTQPADAKACIICGRPLGG